MKKGIVAVSLMALAVAACSKDNATDSEIESDSAATVVDAGVQVKDSEEATPAGLTSWAERAKEDQRDAFTYANYDEVTVTNVDLDLAVSFEEKTFTGTAALDLKYLEEDAEKIILDTNDLNISTIEARVNGTWRQTAYSVGEDDPILGAPLEVSLAGKPDRLRVTYSTSPEAEGLQWLSPEQTAGKTHPFLFSQFQPLLARGMAPLQDTPAVRITYSARIKTPPELRAIMSAAQDEGPRDGDYSFLMPQPIPSYLLAIVVGDFEFKSISETMGIYAESDIIDDAVAEFEDTPLMEEAIVGLYGPYRWGRFDMIVLPPSFPFGGMENPRLTFLTPTLIAGDKSLTNVVAHELAHSWSGNLITNATWRDVWLNEGFTVYVENRVMEELYGVDRATMERALDLESLKRDVAAADRPEVTAFKMPVDLEHPDVAFSQVSYAGGMFFLKFLEDRFGREVFDEFVKSYFADFAFKSLTTEEFLPYFEENLWSKNRDAVTQAEIDEWIYEPGIPDTLPVPISDALDKVSVQQKAWLDGGAIADINPDEWTAHEWLHFINSLPQDLAVEQFSALDERFEFSKSKNAEIANAWYAKSIVGGYAPALEPLEGFLMRVGRGKFIYPLYLLLINNGERERAERVYAEARPGYHPIAQRRLDAIFADR